MGSPDLPSGVIIHCKPKEADLAFWFFGVVYKKYKRLLKFNQAKHQILIF